MKTALVYRMTLKHRVTAQREENGNRLEGQQVTWARRREREERRGRHRTSDEMRGHAHVPCSVLQLDEREEEVRHGEEEPREEHLETRKWNKAPREWTANRGAGCPRAPP